MKNYEATQFHLREAKVHLEELIASVNEGKEGAVTFKYQMAHLYHHVNSAWNTRRIRSLDDPILHEKFLEYAEHPTDLTAWGD